jgi:tetratricopeptide (TPR) repeat protein
MVELFAALDRARSRRRVGGVAATATIVAGSLAAWVLRGGPEQSACVDGETEMAAVWSPAVEADLQRRLQIGPRGPALRPSAAIEALEGHFAAWETAWNDTCGEETVRSEAQRECLRQMLMDARGTLAALSTIQPEELPLALDAIAGLEGVDRCTARVPQSIEPHPAADTALASARTLFRLGRFDAARDELVAADDLVDVPDSKRARLLLLTARIDTYPPDTPVPQGRIVEAAGLARRGSDGALEAEIWLFRAALASHRGEVDVDPWLALADVALGASRPTPWFVAERASVVGMAAAAREEYPAAALALRKAVATARAAWGDDDSRTAGYLDNLGIVLRQAGNVREARPAHEQALRVRERALGPLHPAVGRSLMNLAAMDRELGEHEAALHRFARVFEIARFAGGEQNPSMALVLWARADALTALQRDAEALADLRTAYELHREAFGPCDEQTRRARDRWSVKVASLGRDDVGEDPVCPG